MSENQRLFEDVVAKFCEDHDIPAVALNAYVRLCIEDATDTLVEGSTPHHAWVAAGKGLSSPAGIIRYALFQEINNARRKPVNTEIMILDLVHQGELTETAKLHSDVYDQDLAGLERHAQIAKETRCRRGL